LAGTDKEEIIGLARKIGTYAISAEPFHDCCPTFLPRQPALYASPVELTKAESNLDVEALVAKGIRAVSLLKFEYKSGLVEVAEIAPRKNLSKTQTALA
jgi:tRNA uracil 4-sulfurtransferase